MRRLLVASLIALALPSAAFAHATLLHATPGIGVRVSAPPSAVSLTFDQTVTGLANAIEVKSSVGRLVSERSVTQGGGHVVVAALRPLSRGAYTVRWHVISGDGHVISGIFTFGVRYPAPPVTAAYGASGPTSTEHAVRWAYFVALALLVGGVGFRLIVLPGPLGHAAERRFFIITGIGALAMLEIGIIAFILRAEDALQLPFGRLLYGDLSPVASGTRFGEAFIAMTLGFALVSALLFLAWLTDRSWLLWPTFVLGLGFASGLSLSGHSAADTGSSWLSELADWIHLSAATLWIGGLVQLALVVWPLAPERRARAFLSFSRVATFLIALLLSAGIYLSVLRLPHLHDLWRSGYGHVLLVKLSLVSVALLWGASHHFLAAPRVARSGGGTLGRLRRSLIGESMVGTAVLLVAAVLVDSKPPPVQPGPQPVQSAFVRH